MSEPISNFTDGEVVIKSSQLKIIEAHLVYIDGLTRVLHNLATEYGKSAVGRKIDFIAMQYKKSNDKAINAVNNKS